MTDEFFAREVAFLADVSRIVYTSTVGCIGLPKEVNGQLTPTDEDTPVSETQMSNHYKLSKWRAEVVARELAQKGAPVVIVNPSAPVGPRDVKPTPTGKVIVDFLKRAMPAYLDTGLNWVHVRDVAVGHILAAERGVERASVTLHVGAGTFQPVKTERIDQHVMHHEVYRIPALTVSAIERCRELQMNERTALAYAQKEAFVDVRGFLGAVAHLDRDARPPQPGCRVRSTIRSEAIFSRSSRTLAWLTPPGTSTRLISVRIAG